MLYDKGFTREDMIYKSYKKGTSPGPDDLLSGRALTDRSLAVIANYRLALKYFDEYTNTDGQIPSGKTLEDALFYVRGKMFEKLQGAKNNRSNSRRNNKGGTVDR